MSKEKRTEDFYRLDPLNVSTEMVKIEAMKWAYFEGIKSCEQEISRLRQLLKNATHFVDIEKFENYNYASPIYYWVKELKELEIIEQGKKNEDLDN